MMAYKVYTKKLSAYEKKLKQARQERRQEKRQRTLSLQDLRSAEQIVRRFSAALASMNARAKSILATDNPASLPPVGNDMAQTMRNFSEAGVANTLREAMRYCDGELMELFWVFVLGCGTAPDRTRAAQFEALL